MEKGTNGNSAALINKMRKNSLGTQGSKNESFMRTLVYFLPEITISYTIYTLSLTLARSFVPISYQILPNPSHTCVKLKHYRVSGWCFAIT